MPTPLSSPGKPRSTHGRVGHLLDAAQARGQLVVALDELVETSALSHIAVRRQLEHLAERVVRLPGRPSAFLIVAPEHRARGAPPVASWLGDYFALKDQRYYLGLLSAAAIHGSAQQAVQVAQVLTTRPLRPLEIGRVRVEFFVKASLEQTPLAELHGLPAPLAVSTPEATALDLIAFHSRIGGIRRAAQVIASMRPVMSATGLRRALAAEPQISVKQRLGYVLEVLGMTTLAQIIERALPARMAPAILQPSGKVIASATAWTGPWKVIDNIQFRQAQE